MPNLTDVDIKKIAQLAKLSIKEEDFPLYQMHLSNTLKLVAQMEEIDTNHVSPMAHPLAVKQRLRPDVVTEPNTNALLQLAPLTEANLFLVPKVIKREKA
jgi:aspartyl-tRNA(Asn)/glutamyl-tRNA(Gln) amidotransferase subunit C